MARDWKGITAAGLARTTISLDLTFWLGGGPAEHLPLVGLG